MVVRYTDERQDKLSDFLWETYDQALAQAERPESTEQTTAVVRMMHGQGVALEHVISRLRDVADMIDETQAKAARQTAQEIRRLGTIVAMSSFLIILVLVSQRWH